MKVIYKSNTIQREQDYPNKDIATPVKGLNPAIQFYWIEETKPINENPQRYNLIQQPDVLTDTVHPTYSHLKICKMVWLLVQKTEPEVIQMLNDDLGMYLDTNYPTWERDKDIRKYMYDKVPNNEKQYIKSVDEWMDNCRILRDQKEAAFLNNPLTSFPTFSDYPSKPVRQTIKT